MAKRTQSPLSKLNSDIRTIATSAKKLDSLVHSVAVRCLSHAKEHGDTRPLAQLTEAVTGGGYRVKGLMVWTGTFSPIRKKNTDDGSISFGIMKPGSKSFTDWNIESADANPFWTLAAADEKPKPLSFEVLMELIQRQIKKADSVDENGEIHNDEGRLTYKLDDGENVVDFKAKADKLKKAIAPLVAAA